MRKRLIIFLTFIIFPMLLITGFASWIIVGEKSVAVGLNPIAEPVCYYVDSDGNTNKYTKIEKALENANKEASSTNPLTVYVYTNTNPTITIDCTIGENTTLCLPYDGTTYYMATDKDATNFNWGTSKEFADTDPNTYRQNRVTISSDVTLTNNGILQVGGVFGRKDAGPTGNTNGNYCEIILEENASIISNGNIECYGFIKETYNDNGSKVILNSGKLNIPFMVYDFKSGTLTLASYNEDIAPFNIYDIANIQSLLRIYSGVEVIAEYRMEMSDTPFSGQMIFIGSNNAGLILRSGYIDFQYSSDTYENGTSRDVVEGQTVVKLYGKLNVGTIKITVSGYDMDSSKWFFPLSYKFKFIIMNKSEMTVPNKVKFMPGSSLEVQYGGKLNLDSQVIFYPEGYVEAGSKDYYYPDNLSAAEIINNGTIIVGTSGALAIAGDTNIIKVTDTTEAILEIYNASSVSSNDDITGSLLGVVHDYNLTITGAPYANVTENNSSFSRTQLGGNIYEGVTLSDGQKGWRKLEINSDPITINYFQVKDGETTSFTDHDNLTTGDVDTGLVLSSPSLSGYIFKGWYLDANGEELINNGQLSGLTLFRKSSDGELNVYAIFEKGKVVNIKYVDANGYSITGTDYNYQVSPGTTITLADVSNVIIASDNTSSPESKTKYVINNWIIDETTYKLGDTYTIPIDAEDESTITIKMSGTISTYYRAIVSGVFSTLTLNDIDGEIAISVDKNSLETINSTTYYVLYKSNVIVGTYGELGSFSVGASRTITIEGGISKSVTAAGDRNWGGLGSDGRTEGKITFSMPAAPITITVT